jgi:hypothetical protein
MAEGNKAHQETTAGRLEGSIIITQSNTSSVNGTVQPDPLGFYSSTNFELLATLTSPKPSSPNNNGPSNPNPPSPKTDKPRPHTCAICTRLFARLEHLKRHKRCHTKEKPFECLECLRCFARRDDLLRHQQKLHSTITASPKARSGRIGSAASIAGSRVRTKSDANNGGSGKARPRANTFSTLDSATLGILSDSGMNVGRNFHPRHSQHNNINRLSAGAAFDHCGMAAAQHTGLHSLPKLETSLPSNSSGGLRTALPYGRFGVEFGVHNFGFGTRCGNSINSHALHLNGCKALPQERAAGYRVDEFGK